MKIKGSENCYGDQINNSRNLYSAYDVYDNAENSKYIVNGFNANYVYDAYGFGDQQEKAYEIVDTGLKSVNQYFCVVVHNTNNVFYCQNCYNSSHLFGCIGLKSKSYCIFNKQYTREEYETLVPKIISHMMKTGEWGEFFPSSLSPFGYNETIANEYYPLTREEVVSPDSFSESGLKKGKIFNWSDYEAPFPQVEKIIPASKLPENIAEIPDDILNRAIECEVSKKPFKIIKEELDFYRKHNLPIPRRHPDQRHLDRMKLRNPRKLYTRICDCPTCEENHKNIGKFKEEDFEINKKTGKKGLKIQTTYAPEIPEIVYCENCYNKEVY